MRWVVGVDRNMLEYIMREELQREMLRGRARMRVWGYERKLESREGGELARGNKEKSEKEKSIRRMKGREENFLGEKRVNNKDSGQHEEKRDEIKGEVLVKRERKR